MPACPASRWLAMKPWARARIAASRARMGLRAREQVLHAFALVAQRAFADRLQCPVGAHGAR
ncbi:MAG: hypothetical protein WDN72_10900 [Alphaproteobacteria bacterium]